MHTVFQPAWSPHAMQVQFQHQQPDQQADCSETKQRRLSELDETKARWKVQSSAWFPYLLSLSKNQQPLN